MRSTALKELTLYDEGALHTIDMILEDEARASYREKIQRYLARTHNATDRLADKLAAFLAFEEVFGE
jgi:hypothetical protein